MMRSKTVISALLSTLIGTSAVLAEDINVIFGRVNEMVKAQNYAKALSELEWARKEVEKLHNERMATFLPDDLAGLKGGKTEYAGALGFTSLEKTYTDGKGTKVKVSLTGGSPGGAMAGGLGGLAQIGKMAAMFGGNQPGTETFRVNGRTATLETKANGADLDLFLDGGSFLKFEGSGANAPATLKTMAEALKLDDLEKYLRGGNT